MTNPLKSLGARRQSRSREVYASFGFARDEEQPVQMTLSLEAE
jgi:hypothetical protein